ncbi:MAG: NFACT family protein [Firmicutes bacterium]|nr:NFACT family protein [Alicyclobacillaceae bacterium]MCL6496483.1 NFACT family protein [Bacillota bacterium]
MPIDALVLRRLEAIWQAELVGTRFDRVEAGPGRAALIGYHPQRRERVVLLIVWQPGFARVHRVRRRLSLAGAPAPAFWTRFLPFTVDAVRVPPWERVVEIRGVRHDEWDLPVPLQLVVELTGTHTNVIWVDASGTVLDAIRLVSGTSKGRVVLPGHPYTPLVPPPDPCVTRDAAALPPWARLLLEHEGEEFWQRLCRDWGTRQWKAWQLTGPSGESEVWVYPLPGWQAEPAEDLEAAIDAVFMAREEAARRLELHRQLAAEWRRRLDQISERMAELSAWLEQDGEADRRLGDLWLSYQGLFVGGRRTASVVDWETGTPVTLTLAPGQTPAAAARAAYTRYRKLRHRREAALRLLPDLERERAAVQAQLEALESGPHPLAWYEAQGARPSARRPAPPRNAAFRRYTSIGGFTLLVGRNQQENHRLTFQVAQPDDLWFHVKQGPGAHVVLRTERRQPSHEDLLDAAHLAAFFSPAAHSSLVPVDYTQRKFVRKRPHAEPGEVLYRQEKTLFITPDRDRLKRLGAVRDPLGDLP